MTDYTSVKIPKILSDKIQSCNYYNDYGFTSVSSFVLFAIRELIRNA